MQGPRFPSHATQLVPRTELTAHPALPNRSPYPLLAVLAFLVLITEGPPLSGAPTRWLKTVVPPSQECAGSHHTCPHLLDPSRQRKALHRPTQDACLSGTQACQRLIPPPPAHTTQRSHDHFSSCPPHTCAPIRRPPISLRLSGGESSQHCAPLLFLWPPRLPPLLGWGDASANAPHLLRELLCQTLLSTQTPRTCLPYSAPSLSL